ncbi:tRNA (adenosine(37)-N6)-threonylcarbamoyltransferase complex ATPase subunit type 1 TsaE [Rhizobium sp. TRM95111]|uniref:tRNA (adenosine(37)-N6)-threonylcarbamoyltransferase complex ATPase subunit type 1 TsaE n=1 Tax=Rhizobium alarense TaxID=2846851 RepID=UPI001F010C8E|nr:tRNA (adenosine(37)-N6)-threonylcarbamoyltransferase complex ATPase subunit type 1 TsaE [Rhizobium alarense]MCF3639929.1 tRNA (adenosine(37)-N6)-threonylcarbamoyltransferase complex ATPase subunit type 1 TsaE [Rhizobium alarense]
MSIAPLFLEDEAATIRFGEDLARAVRPGDLITLSGDLGAGKSTLARALIRAIADDAALEVPSPTFTLVQSYALSLPVSHFDFYRLADAEEVDELGLDEALEDGVCLVEWPEKAEAALPADRLTLRFVHEGTGRRIEFAGGREGLRQRIARSLAIRDFLIGAGHADAMRRHLTGDASVRAYETVTTADGGRMVLMDAPAHVPGPIIVDGKYYQQIAHIAENVRPFVAVDRHLAARGFAVPAIFHEDLGRGLLLIEDLGRESVLDEAGLPVVGRYEAAVDCLARLHAQPAASAVPVSDGTMHRIPDFDRDAIQIEVGLLTDWYLPWKRGTPATEDERRAYRTVWDDLIETLRSAERNLLLRDFHSPNIIWRPQAAGIDRVGIIDFQDAMIGPTAYDVASLTQDARVDMPEGLTETLLARYLALRATSPGFDAATFRRDWHVMAAQRNCKLVGIWVRLMQRDGKPGYMKHMPRTFRNLETALSHPALAPLRAWCEAAGIR